MVDSIRSWRRGLVMARNRLLGIRQLEQRIISLEDRLKRSSGAALFCPICGHTAEQFGPGPNGRPDAACPGCGSLERHRLIWLYLHAETDLLSRPQQVLHLAPERCFRERLKAIHADRYVTGDLSSPLADVKVDLQAMPFDDASFDVILCSHVLEHIPDDAKAMRELRRAVRPGGYCFVNVPLSGRPDTDEDSSVTSPEERTRRFGQHDHLRYYGDDIVARLQRAGFDVEVIRFAERIPNLMQDHLRLGDETFFIARPAGTPRSAQ